MTDSEYPFREMIHEMVRDLRGLLRENPPEFLPIPAETYRRLMRPWTERDERRWRKRFLRRQRRARRDRWGW